MAEQQQQQFEFMESLKIQFQNLLVPQPQG
jgi:hypothetical protein